MVFGCIAGAFLGIAFIIPLRKQMIDYERLTYPGGVAVATILKSPGAGMQKAMLLLAAAVVAELFRAISLSSGLENINIGASVGLPEYMNGIWYVSYSRLAWGLLQVKAASRLSSVALCVTGF